MIACDKCGAALEGQASLARHLRDDHGMIAGQAIALAKEINACYRDKDERIRRAAPELLAACEIAEAYFSASVLGTQEAAIVAQLRTAIAKAKGTDGD
jgi:hypothetical protein